MATISKRGQRWFAQIRRKGFTPRYRSFDRQRDALQWAREQELALGACSMPCESRKRTTLGQLLERYSREISVNKKGVESECLRIAKMRRAPLASLPLYSLTPAAVAAYRDDRLRVVEPGTVRRELGILHHVIEVARREWGFRADANAVASIARPTVRDQRDRRVGCEELRRLRAALSKARNRYMSPVVEFALATAMRRGEILKLSWSDIDFGARVASLHETKNGRSRRVPLSKSLIQN